ncbi:putative bacteriophage baseplate assembly-like protein (plasmid) [Ralstonia solanacearum CMR15]|nr:putative bacteriophage baseplate assembly-like protein [Ralstonia solanacearum CMR15]
MAGMNNSTGRALTDLPHVAQLMRDILTPPIGSRVMRRDYGSRVAELIDRSAAEPGDQPAHHVRCCAGAQGAVHPHCIGAILDRRGWQASDRHRGNPRRRPTP